MPKTLLDQGVAAFNASRYAQAAKLFASALSADPDLGLEAELFLVYSLRFSGDEKKALASLHACLDRRPNEPRVLIALGDALRDAGKLEEAEGFYRRAGDGLKVADVLRRREKYAESDAAYRAALKNPSPEAAVYLGWGDCLLRLAKTAEAEAAYLEALKRAPDSFDALMRAGLLACDAGRAGEAADFARRAGKLAPKDARPRLLLGQSLLKAAAPRDAAQAFAEADKLEPGNIYAKLGRAEALARAGADDEALAAYDQAAKSAKGDVLATVYAESAEVLLRRGRTDEAVVRLKRAAAVEPHAAIVDLKLGALTLDPAALAKGVRAAPPRADDSVELRLERIHALLVLGKYADAFAQADALADASPSAETIELLTNPLRLLHRSQPLPRPKLRAELAAAARKPGACWAVLCAANLASTHGTTAEAVKLSAPLAAAPPRLAWMRFQRGKMLLRADDAEGARAEFRAAAAAAPHFWKAEAFLAEAALCAGDETAAFKIMDRLAAGGSPQALAWRGEFHLWLGRAAQALKDLDASASAAARSATQFAHGWRGAALLLSDRLKDAVRDLDEALKVSPRDAESLVWRAEAAMKQGDAKMAIACLDLALKEDESNCFALADRALAHEAQGDPEAMWNDYWRIPAEIREVFNKAAGVTVNLERRPCSREELRRILETGLKTARGVRRNESYLLPLWAGKVRSSQVSRRSNS